MSARVFDVPDGYAAPSFEDDMVDGRFNLARMQANEQAYLRRLRDWLSANGYTGELAGEEVRWHRGDGYARYLVMRLRPLDLMHLPLGDAWEMDPIFMRGLRADDVRNQVERQKKLVSLFGRKEKANGE